MTYEYILTEVKYKQFLNRYGNLLCAKCKEPLKIHDKIVSTKSSPKRRSKRYHKECYEKLFIDV